MTPHARPPSALRSFFVSETVGGFVLLGAAALALWAANSPLADVYFAALHAEIGSMGVVHWINDGLMVLFFLLVGLEIKRELVDGELSTWPRRVLPGAAAAGGMVAPALIYLALQVGDPTTSNGWAIPAATDIAFALGVLSLLGSRVPVSLKVFLTALAIIDDLGAVLIIAVFYTDDITTWALIGAGAALALLVTLNRCGVKALTPYLLVGLIMWWLVLQSGAHPTIAGVALALTIPLKRSRAAPDDAASPLHRLEHALQPWVAFLVVPVFGFANAGVSFQGLSLQALLAPAPLGVAAGLFMGKQLGVFAAASAVIGLGWADRPTRASLLQLYGVAVLCGVGFTMSLFIGLLAFESEALQEAAKLGVLVGSSLSAVVGWLILRVARQEAPPAPPA